jgi:hypothetical protein
MADTYDVIICGAGSGGGFLAERLRRMLGADPDAGRGFSGPYSRRRRSERRRFPLK